MLYFVYNQLLIIDITKSENYKVFWFLLVKSLGLDLFASINYQTQDIYNLQLPFTLKSLNLASLVKISYSRQFASPSMEDLVLSKNTVWKVMNFNSFNILPEVKVLISSLGFDLQMWSRKITLLKSFILRQNSYLLPSEF